MGNRNRLGYPTDMSDEGWAFVAPYLTLCRKDAEQREYPLRQVFNVLRYIAKTGCHWRMLPNDLPPWQVVYQQMRRWIDARVERMSRLRRRQAAHGSKVHTAADTLGHPLALHVAAADEQDRAQIDTLAEAVQEITGEHVELAYVDPG